MEAHELAELARVDVSRFAESMFRRKGMQVPAVEPTHFPLHGRGPWICLRQGYDSFKGCYCAAQDAIYQKISPHLTENSTLEMDFRYVQDEENPHGDSGYHRWWIGYRPAACDRGHSLIKFDGKLEDCPLCGALDEKAAHEETIKELKDQIDDLETELRNVS